jgi:cell division GTPase FtsZ
MKNDADFLVLAIGGAGCNWMEKMIHAPSDMGCLGRFVAINTVDRSEMVVGAKRIAFAYHIPNAPLKCPPILFESRRQWKRDHKRQQRVAARQLENHLRKSKDWQRHLKDAKAVLLVAGMGGLTGSTCAPVVAKMAKQAGIPVAAVVTMPCEWEGANRQSTAKRGANSLKNTVDHLVQIQSERISRMHVQTYTQDELFEHIDRLQQKAVERSQREFWRWRER